MPCIFSENPYCFRVRGRVSLACPIVCFDVFSLLYPFMNTFYVGHNLFLFRDFFALLPLFAHLVKRVNTTDLKSVPFQGLSVRVR